MFSPKSLIDFLKEDDNSVSWLVRNFWKNGGYTLVSGPPTLARKSFFVERLLLCIAGNKVDGVIEPTRSGVVLYVAEEGPKVDAQDRLKAQCNSLGIDPQTIDEQFFMLHLSGFRLFHPEHMESILEWCDAHNPIAIVLDPWSRVGPDDADNTGASLVCMQAVSEIQRRGISVCIVCHTKKEGKEKFDIDQEVRGSSVLVGAYDTHVALRPREEGKPIPMTVRNKNAAQVEYSLKWNLKSAHNEERNEEHLVWCEPEWKVK